MRRTLLLAALLAAASTDVAAQGALSLQGYGYPTGQLSAGALAVGGAVAETDPASPLNPAAIGVRARYTIYMQFEPEFRRTTVGGVDATSRTMRFPEFVATGGVGRFTGGVSFSTLLDRTWENTYLDSQVVGGVNLPSTLRASSHGAMTDVRFAGSFWVSPKFQVGLGLHAITGQNQLEFGRLFPDSSGVGGVQQTTAISYSGHAVSTGALFAPIPSLLVGASARFGGSLAAHQDGATIAEANVPSRYGIGVSWFGITNTTLSARIDRTAWSQMRDLGTAQMSVFDATDIGLGLDVAGPRIAGALSTGRFGFRDRTLPFGIAGKQVSERALSGGVAIPLARGRGQIDLTLERAARSAAGVNERAWLVSVGFGIRP
jgi:hypothetical protein